MSEQCNQGTVAFHRCVDFHAHPVFESNEKYVGLVNQIYKENAAQLL